jgi:hypothetical protein
MDNINWTKAHDEKSEKPLTTIPPWISRPIRNANPTAKDPTKKLCPSPAVDTTSGPGSYSHKTKLFYFPGYGVRRCDDGRVDQHKERGWRRQLQDHGPHGET